MQNLTSKHCFINDVRLTIKVACLLLGSLNLYNLSVKLLVWGWLRAGNFSPPFLSKYVTQCFSGMKLTIASNFRYFDR